jgi:hypothetical protein
MALPVILSGLNSFQRANIEEFVESITISYTMDYASEIVIKLKDPGFNMLNNNYFAIRRPLQYFFGSFEIASVNVEAAGGFDPSVTIEARSAGVQRLKRNKTPEGFGATAPSEFVQLAANSQGLRYVGIDSPEVLTITTTQYYENMESTWDVMRRVASDAQFVVWEADGTLYFAPQWWLLYRYGNVSCSWPSAEGNNFQLIECPTLRRSDNDPYEADFTALFDRTNGIQLRPGMTIKFNGIPTFDVPFLITEVSWQEDSGLPVSVSGRTPAKFKEKEPNSADA